MSGGSFFRLSLVFVLGAAAGIWTIVEPWVTHYPFGTGHQWSSSTWSNVWVGAIVTAVSLVALVLVVAAGLRAVEAAQAETRAATARTGRTGAPNVTDRVTADPP